MAGVNVKMGVSGIQQFKQGMKESQAAVKTLGAELKLNEQQLKANGDAQQYMETKTKLLQEQIKAQTNVVNQSQKALEAMAKSGVKESSTAFQQMKQQSLAAQTQLVELQNQLDGVGEAGEEAANDLSGIGHQLDSIRRNTSWSNIAEDAEKITEKMQAAGRAAWEMGKKIVHASLSGGQWADDLATTATQWQMTPEQVYRMQQTANLIDTSAETIFQSRQKLLKAMGSESDKSAMGAFAALGISDLSGTEKNIEDVFWTAGEGLMQMEDKVAQNEYAMKLFGRSWSEMIPIFQAGRKAYEETYNSWTWMGDEQFEKLGQMNDEQMKLETEWEAFQHQFEAALAPAITEVMSIMQQLMHEFNIYLQSEDGQKMLQSLGDSVRSLFEELETVKPEEVMEKLKDGLDAVNDGLQWLIDNKGAVVTAIKGIAGGFALLKLTELAANIGRIVQGLGGLKGKGGTPAPTGDGGAAPAPTGGGGGWLTGLSNWMTGAASQAGAAATRFLAQTGGMLPALGDRVLNETNAGRAVRDGGDILAGAQQDIAEKTEEIQKNASTFLDDWSELFKTAGNNAARFWNKVWMGNEQGRYYENPEEILDRRGGLTDEQRAAAEKYWDTVRGTRWDADPEVLWNAQQELASAFAGQEDVVAAVNDLILRLQEDNPYDWRETEDLPAEWDKFAQTAEQMNAETNKATGDMTDAAKILSGMPAEMYTTVANAIRVGMGGISIIINAGAVDTIGRRVSESFGQSLSALVP